MGSRAGGKSSVCAVVGFEVGICEPMALGPVSSRYFLLLVRVKGDRHSRREEAKAIQRGLLIASQVVEYP